LGEIFSREAQPTWKDSRLLHNVDSLKNAHHKTSGSDRDLNALVYLGTEISYMCAIRRSETQSIKLIHRLNLTVTMKFTSITIAILLAVGALAHGGIYSYTIGDKVYQG